MWYSILTALAEDGSTDGGPTSNNSTWQSWLLIGIVVVLIVVMLVISTRRNKKRQKEAENLINAVRPGNKVKTIGGVCGIVVEVDDEENTFVLETGSETSGKCYMKFDKQAIYQTDAVVETEEKEKHGKTHGEDESSAENQPVAEEQLSESVEEAPAEDASQDAQVTEDDQDSK